MQPFMTLRERNARFFLGQRKKTQGEPLTLIIEDMNPTCMFHFADVSSFPPLICVDKEHVLIGGGSMDFFWHLYDLGGGS